MHSQRGKKTAPTAGIALQPGDNRYASPFHRPRDPLSRIAQNRAPRGKKQRQIGRAVSGVNEISRKVFAQPGKLVHAFQIISSVAAGHAVKDSNARRDLFRNVLVSGGQEMDLAITRLFYLQEFHELAAL